MRKAACYWGTLVPAVGLASVSAYVSVSGLMSVFSGHSVEVAAIAGSVEIGKLILAWNLHKHWYRLGGLMRLALMGILFALMALTSSGVYGKLGSAYLDKVPAVAAASLKAEAADKVVREIEARLAEANKPVTTGDHSRKASVAKLELKAESERRAAADVAKAKLVADYREAVAKAAALKSMVASEENELGPAKFLASLMGLSGESAVKLLAMLLVVGLDPLAVLLVMVSSPAVKPVVRKVVARRKVKRKKVVKPAALKLVA